VRRGQRSAGRQLVGVRTALAAARYGTNGSFGPQKRVGSLRQGGQSADHVAHDRVPRRRCWTLTDRAGPPCQLAVAIEAGNQTAWVYEVLVALGAKVTVVNPTKVKLIAESRRKTDKVDAKILCELLRLGGLPEPVHMPDKQTRALRGLLVAAGGGPHQAVQRRARPAAPGGAAAAGPRPAEPGRLGATPGPRVRALASGGDRGRLLRDVPVADGVDPVPGPRAGRVRQARRAYRLAADHAARRADRVADLPGGGRRREPLRLVAEVGGLLRAGADSGFQRRAVRVRRHQPRGPQGAAGGVGADRPPGGDRWRQGDGALAALVPAGGGATGQDDRHGREA